MSLIHGICSMGRQCRRAGWSITHEEARLGSLGGGTLGKHHIRPPSSLEWLQSMLETKTDDKFCREPALLSTIVFFKPFAPVVPCSLKDDTTTGVKRWRQTELWR